MQPGYFRGPVFARAGDAAAVLFCASTALGLFWGWLGWGEGSFALGGWVLYLAVAFFVLLVSIFEVIERGRRAAGRPEDFKTCPQPHEPERQSGFFAEDTREEHVSKRASKAWSSLELSKRVPVLLCASYVLIALSRGLESPAYGLAFLVLASSFAMIESPLGRRLLFCLFVVLELALLSTHSGQPSAGLYFFLHILLGLLFATSYHWLLAPTVRWLRREHQHHLWAERQRWRQAAQDFRLEPDRGEEDGDSSSRPEGEHFAPGRRTEDSDTWAQAAVAAIHDNVGYELERLLEALELHSALLLWTAESESAEGALGQGHGLGQDPGLGLESRRLQVQSFRSHSGESLAAGRFELGVFAPVICGGQRILLSQLELHRSPDYYQYPVALGDLCAVPVYDNDAVRGVLVLDRLEQRGFSADQLETVEKSARHLERCIAQERAFAGARYRRLQQEQLYAASAQLSQALGAQAVQASTLEALSRLLAYDVAFILTSVEGSADENELFLGAHRVRSGALIDPSWEECRKSYDQKRFMAPAGSVLRSAIKNKVVVSPRYIADPAWGISIFDSDSRLLNAQSLAVLPLIFGETCVGLAVLIAGRKGAFEPGALAMAKILSHQVAAALQNARLYDAMQRKATTDGLTGLTNHRSFQERLDQAIAAVERNPQPLSLILTDIDHFKKVNDNYGHPVGDSVLRRVADILQKVARKNDVVARYGGEEFVILLPGSDANCAYHLAERLREQVQETIMLSDQGSFQVTLSLGIAEYRVDARTRSELVDRADQALYWGKRAGRNCVTLWREIKGQGISAAS